MKFDYIIMNPPYGRTLPYKITLKMIDLSSKIIYLGPLRKCYNFIEADNFSIRLQKYIENYKILNLKEANKCFNILSRNDLVIAEISKDSKGIEFNNNEFYSIYKKIAKTKSWRSVATIEDGEFIIPMQGDNGYAKGWKLTIKEILSGNPKSHLVFNSELEKSNFLESIEKWPYKLLYILDENAAVPAHLPWLGNEINPRTKLKGYKSKWTDEDLYIFFSLSKQEISLIKNTIRKANTEYDNNRW